MSLRFDWRTLARRKWVYALGSALATAAFFWATGNKPAAVATSADAMRIAAAALVCEAKLARGEQIDCDQLIVTPIAAPVGEPLTTAVPLANLEPIRAPEPEPEDDGLTETELALTEVSIQLADRDARLSVMERQLEMERTARVDAESRADRMREALTAATRETDAAVNEALNQFVLQMENERATQVCFSRAQWDADRRDLASLCSRYGVAELGDGNQ